MKAESRRTRFVLYLCLHLAAIALAVLLASKANTTIARKVNGLPAIATMYFNTSLGLEPFDKDPGQISTFEATPERLASDPDLARFVKGLSARLEPHFTPEYLRQWRTDVWAIGGEPVGYGWPFVSTTPKIKVYVDSQNRNSGQTSATLIWCGPDGGRPFRTGTFILNAIVFYSILVGAVVGSWIVFCAWRRGRGIGHGFPVIPVDESTGQ